MKSFFKYASLLAAAVMLISCQGTVDTGEGSTSDKTLMLTTDKNLIQTFDGDYATLMLTLDGEVVTDGVTFFDGNDKVMEITDFRFSTDKVGEYVIWANYGTYISDKVTIKAIDITIPDTPVDPKPESTDFKTRVLLTEFTTVGCSACPSMKKVLHSLAEDKEVSDLILFTECHSGLVNNVADPCYLHNMAFEDFCMIQGFPTVKLDLVRETYNNGNSLDIKADVKQMIAAKSAFAPGIAVNSTLKDNKVVAKITVKAKVESSYRVGAFLLEDGISATQTSATADWMHVHDNVIRYVDSQYKNSFYGIPVADIAAGKTADTMISWILDDIWAYGSAKGEVNGGIAWPTRNNNKLHMVVFVTMSDEKGEYQVVNAIDCPLNGETPFDYK